MSFPTSTGMRELKNNLFKDDFLLGTRHFDHPDKADIASDFFRLEIWLWINP
jgi:hypothetical protein